jgi:hypothetical protein
MKQAVRFVNFIQSLFPYIISLLLIALAIGITALVLSGIIYGKTQNGSVCDKCPGMVETVITDNSTLSPIINQTLKFIGAFGIDTSIENIDEITISSNEFVCNNCSGMVNNVSTDNGTLSPIINQTLKFRGISGIQVSILNTDEITIDNKRDVSKYIVNCEGGSEYLTPQEAYLAAVADGRNVDNPANIIIAPCIYDFGDTQFDITTDGISFVGLGETSGGFTNIVFSANDTTGGVHIDLTPNATSGAIFRGISFGRYHDDLGFFINITQGQIVIDECTSPVSNLRFLVSGQSNLKLRACVFYPLPPNDFITVIDAFPIHPIISLENTRIQDTAFSGPFGGYMFNIESGGVVVLRNSFLTSYIYDGIFKGAASGQIGDIRMQNMFVDMPYEAFANPIGCFLRQSGAVNTTIVASNITTQGPLIYQTVDSVLNDIHNLLVTNSYIVSNTFAVIENDPAVTIMGINDYKFYNSQLRAINDPYVINVPAGTGSDLLQVLFFAVAVESTSPPLGAYAFGPALLSTIRTGASVSVNGATSATNFVSTPLQVI